MGTDRHKPLTSSIVWYLLYVLILLALLMQNKSARRYTTTETYISNAHFCYYGPVISFKIVLYRSEGQFIFKYFVQLLYSFSSAKRLF